MYSCCKMIQSSGEDQIAALIIFMIAGFGMTCNWFIVLFIRRLPSLQNPFGRLLGSQAIGEAIHLTIFTLFVAPMVFFDITFLKDISPHAGHALLICYDICIYCHFFIALNRLCAVYTPLHYNKIFNYRTTSLFIAISWITAILPSFYFYVWEDCHFYYLGDFWHFVFSNNDICNFITWYTDFLKYVSFVVVIGTIDIITVLKFHFVNSAVMTNTSNTRKSDEINFLKQACLEAFVFTCELLTYFVFIAYFDHRWVKFGLSTVAWTLVHTLDGVITISFNREFRQLLYRKVTGKSSNYAATASSTGNSHRPPHQ